MACPAWELFFGGAKWGGKTDYLLADFAQDAPQWGSAWRGILFRRTYPELEEIIYRALELYPRIFPGALYSKTSKTWHFPGGARLKLRSLERKEDIGHYQGHAYTWIGWDELPQHADDFAYLEMMSCVRSPQGAPVRVRSTGNPGGPGHLWVKARFIDICPPYKLYTDPDTGFTRCFIPSFIDDNPASKVDRSYSRRLDMLPDHLRRMYKYGDWSVVAGAYFSGIWDETKHVVRSFKIPRHWHRFRALDWGSYRPFSVGWYAVDTESRVYRYREWYGMNGKPNEGLRLDSRTVARGILDREKEAGDAELIEYGVADPSIFAQHDGPSVAEKMAEEGVAWRPADNDRLNGWQNAIDYLQWRQDGEKRPGFMTFDTCHHFRRTIPALTHDERKPDDVDTEQEDHAADEWRYALMSRPRRTLTLPEYVDMAERRAHEVYTGHYT